MAHHDRMKKEKKIVALHDHKEGEEKKNRLSMCSSL
jgi:hypothetical protein